MTHIDSKDNGNDGADQRPPAAKEEDAASSKDSKDQCSRSIVSAVLSSGDDNLRLLPNHRHIGMLWWEESGTCVEYCSNTSYCKSLGTTEPV